MVNSTPSNIDLCILIPSYNNFEGLLISLNSIQYIKDRFAVIVVDDGSPEPVSPELISRMTGVENLAVIRLEKNQGITKALNKGLEYIYENYSARFIARLDCGDTCSPRRFYTQIAFFEKNPDVHLTGTWCYFKNSITGKAYGYKPPTSHRQITRDMYFRNVFIHPTVMWRSTGTGQLNYPEQYPCAEDYGLFYEMTLKLKSAIINEYLVTCEINSKGISLRNRSTQLKSRIRVVLFYGSNKMLRLVGALKISLLMIIPYNLIFYTKNILYKTA